MLRNRNDCTAIPAPMCGAFVKAETTLTAGIASDKTSTFAIAEITQTILSRADMREILQRPVAAARTIADHPPAWLRQRPDAFGTDGHTATAARWLQGATGFDLSTPAGSILKNRAALL